LLDPHHLLVGPSSSVGSRDSTLGNEESDFGFGSQQPPGWRVDLLLPTKVGITVSDDDLIAFSSWLMCSCF